MISILKSRTSHLSASRLQNDGTVNVFIGGIKAAGVGLTLTKSAHVVFAELDWVPASLTQAEDRCHRIGQEESVLVQHIVLEGSIDALIAKSVVKKQAIADTALDKEIDPTEAEGPTLSFDDPIPAKIPAKKEIDGIAEDITQEEILAVHTKLKFLASVCDGAATEDGHAT